jgi:putative ABC transport system permease protein
MRSRADRAALAAFQALIRLYPTSYRDEYGREMTLVFVDGLRQDPNAAARVLSAAVALFGVLLDAPRQHAALLAQDLGLTLRLMRREPWFAAAAIGTIAIGIGLTNAVFSVAKSLLIDALPYPGVDRAAMVWVSNPSQGFDRDYTSYPRLLDWRERSRLIEAFAGFTLRGAVATGVGEPEQLRTAWVSPEFFDVVRGTPVSGRLFAPGEEQAQVVVLGYGLWQRKFAGDPRAVGATLHLDSIPYTIVGILPHTFQFPERGLDAWVPLQPGPQERSQRGPFWLSCVARLAPGVSVAEAGQEMNAIARRLAAEHASDRDLGVTLVSLRDEIAGPFTSALFLLTAAAVGVLLIACANVAGMLTARGAARRREVAIRTALGANRRRIARQLLTEGVALFVTGGVLGVAVAMVTLRLLVRSAPPGLSQLHDVSLDLPMVAAALGMALITGLVFGVLPSWHATRVDVAEGLGTGVRGIASGGVSQRFRRALLIGQLAIATIVVSSACLFIRSLIHMQSVELGFEPRGVVAVRLHLPKIRYLGVAARIEFFDRLLERVRDIPGVTSAAAGSSILLGRLPTSAGFTAEGRPEMIQEPLTDDAVTPDFFRLLQVPLLRGRFFSAEDRADAPAVAIINETTARKHWRDTDPIGKRFKFGSLDSDAPWLTVVGVVADTRRAGVDHPAFTESYQPHTQSTRTGSMWVLVRTAPAASIVSAIRAAVRELDTDQPLARVARLEELLDERTAARRFNTWLLSGFGGTAVALGAVGLYSLLAYIVVLRRQEMALRLAIGATPRDVLALLVRNVSVLVGSGIGLGLAGALAVAPLMRDLLFEIQPADPLSQAAVVVVLAAVAVIATWVPARRAMRIDPATALRDL